MDKERHRGNGPDQDSKQGHGDKLQYLRDLGRVKALVIEMEKSRR